jgi:hypothetical protein
MTTYFRDPQRKEIAELTLRSWVANMKYDGELCLHVADDGSDLAWEPEKIWPGLISFSRQERHGLGASLNAGFAKAFETSPLVFYCGGDDWQLQQPFDLSPWAQVLVEHEDVGIVRLGPPSPFLRGEVVIYTENWQGWGLKLEPYGLCAGFRPEIFHKRLIDTYGWWKEDINASECERLFNVQWAADPKLHIVLALPHPWYHADTSLGVPSLSEIEPG